MGLFCLVTLIDELIRPCGPNTHSYSAHFKFFVVQHIHAVRLFGSCHDDVPAGLSQALLLPLGTSSHGAIFSALVAPPQSFVSNFAALYASQIPLPDRVFHVVQAMRAVSHHFPCHRNVPTVLNWFNCYLIVTSLPESCFQIFAALV
jgi:hypothetical protein